ncbi:type I-E CRISPR-associated protein Cse1/CasA [Saccharomonospora sp. NPDC006951]
MNESWIPVVGLDGRVDEVSLCDIFLRAHELRWLDAEAPPVTASLHRLLIAVLHRILDGPKNRHEWAEAWAHLEKQADGNAIPALPADRIIAYFDNHAGEFDLFDASRPFLQCPALGKLEARSAGQLVHFRAVGNNATLFDHTTGGDLTLTPAEAARWLVTVQAYDTGGLKTPFTTTKQSVVAPCNRFGVALVEGKTLRETLLLNTCEYDPASDKPWSSANEDRPAWEAEVPAPEPDERMPYGWLDLLTWPSRRVLLRPAIIDGALAVDGAVVTPGTQLKDDLDRVEQMAAFERRPTKSKKDLAPFTPVRLQELRGVWRHAREMLLAEQEERHRRPALLDQVAEQVEWGTLSRHEVFTIRVFGQQLDDSGGGSVYTWLQEQLPAPAALLNARDEEVGAILGHCVALADGLGAALVELVAACRRMFEAEWRPSSVRAAKRNAGLAQDYWPQLPAPFAKLLLQIGEAVESEASPEPAIAEWRDTVRHVAQEAADQLVVQLRDRQARHLFALAGAYDGFARTVAKRCNIFDAHITGYLP